MTIPNQNLVSCPIISINNMQVDGQVLCSYSIISAENVYEAEPIYDLKNNTTESYQLDAGSGWKTTGMVLVKQPL